MERDLLELYQLKRSSGYGSGIEDFRSFLNYQARLERLDKTGALSPSPSLVDLHSKARQDEGRRHSYPDHVDLDFLQRAIQKAQDALKGPKPPKPFSPSLDMLHTRWRKADQEIEERIHPTRKPLPASLPPAEDAEVDALFRRQGTIAKCGREQVSNADILRLRPAQWLNDEIINFYGQMILARAESSKENPSNSKVNGRNGPINAHYLSSFFWAKLKGQGYQKGRLAKWTKQVDIFSKDVILIPVNHNNAHWTAAAINFRKKRIESYDSMGMERGQVFKILRQYLDDEHRDKKKKPFDFTGWTDYVLPDTPQQENGYDCGVFTCQFLESLSRGEETFDFTQKNMPYLRRKMVWEIGGTRLREEP
ncbi:cysteine proteinase [Epithele typhae]|uniref:cysteine proteinase n=1 Tax=Epithele typhae TaxID=378194 RepID=UPI002007889C|nr:cysteine proteinase [Epithele typhae]KAH9921976.1 cysteine proteinase [Epithele typhae]